MQNLHSQKKDKSERDIRIEVDEVRWKGYLRVKADLYEEVGKPNEACHKPDSHHREKNRRIYFFEMRAGWNFDYRSQNVRNIVEPCNHPTKAHSVSHNKAEEKTYCCNMMEKKFFEVIASFWQYVSKETVDMISIGIEGPVVNRLRRRIKGHIFKTVLKCPVCRTSHPPRKPISLSECHVSPRHCYGEVNCLQCVLCCFLSITSAYFIVIFFLRNYFEEGNQEPWESLICDWGYYCAN